MEVQLKELLAWATAAEDDQAKDDQAMELHPYFLRDKEFFDGRGNVEFHYPRGGLLKARTRQVSWTQTGCTASGPTRWIQARVVHVDRGIES